MSNRRTPVPPAPPSDDADAPFDHDFDPVPTRARHDGWHPDKQVAFIDALAASGCVDHAAKAVGKAVGSAYRLRARADAQSFRAAWDFALEYAVTRLADAALSRAIHGVARPVFFKGEQIGERRYFDERLAMFVLRTRDPARFGSWIDHVERVDRHPEATALGLARAANTLSDHGWAQWLGTPRPATPIAFPRNHVTTESDLLAGTGAADESHHHAVANHEALRVELDIQRRRADAAERRARVAEAAWTGARTDDV